MFGFMVFCVATIILILYSLVIKKDPLSNMPGPKPIFFFGNILQLFPSKLHIRLHEMSKKYGGVFRIYIFSKPIIIVSSPKILYELLVKRSGEFSGRPSSFRIDLLDGPSGILRAAVGPEHKARRKLLHKFLMEHGTGMKRIEAITMNAVTDLVQAIVHQNGNPITVHKLLFNCVTEIMAILVSGDNVSEDVTHMKIVADNTLAIIAKDLSGEILDRFPFMRYFGNDCFKKGTNTNELQRNLLSKWRNSAPANGFISFLQGLSEHEKQKYGIPLEKHENRVCMDFIVAGIFTTSTMLTVFFNVLAQVPTVQNKLREEIKFIIGSRNPSLKDRDNMPFFNAILLELGRFASILPFLTRTTVQNTTIEGFSIPAGMEILVNLWSIHHNEELWEEPFKFDPSRFLDEKGQLVRCDHPNRKNSLPFGVGHRVCPGENLAVNRMFLIISRLVQCFEIEPESTSDEQPSMDPRDMKDKHVLMSPEYKVRFKRLL